MTFPGLATPRIVSRTRPAAHPILASAPSIGWGSPPGSARPCAEAALPRLGLPGLGRLISRAPAFKTSVHSIFLEAAPSTSVLGRLKTGAVMGSPVCAGSAVGVEVLPTHDAPPRVASKLVVQAAGVMFRRHPSAQPAPGAYRAPRHHIQPSCDARVRQVQEAPMRQARPRHAQGSP